MRKLYIQVKGGLGLNFGLASFISWVKKNMSDEYEFYICSPYSDVFEVCTSVDGVYKSTEIKDFIFDAVANDGELIVQRLYDMDLFIKKRINYSQAWAKLCNIPFEDTENGTKVTSNLSVYDKYPSIKNSVDAIKNAIKEKGFKKYIICQFCGGQSPLVEPNADWSKIAYDYENEPLKRHYPIKKAQEFCEKFYKKHKDCAIIMYQLPNEPKPNGENIVTATVPYLAYYELAKDAIGIVCIDSSLQHMCGGVTKTVVLWGHSKPKNFGYSYNKNIEQKCRTDDLLYFTELGASGAKISYIESDELLDIVEETLFNK